MEKSKTAIFLVIGLILIGITVLTLTGIVNKNGIISNMKEKLNNKDTEIKELKKENEELEEQLKNQNTSNNKEESYQEPTPNKDNQNNENSSSKPTQEYSNLEEITVTELAEKIGNKETFILLISQPYCSHCIRYKPVLNNVLLKYNIRAYEVNIYDLSTEDKTKFNNLISISGTPTTMIYVDGVEQLDRLEGEEPTNKIEDYLRKHNFIK